MTRVLIAYATRMGSTEAIARAIAERIHHRGLETVVRPVSRVRTLAGIDAVIVGSAVYLRRWLPEAMHWLKANAPELAERPTWLFQSGPCGPDPADPEQVPHAVERLAFGIGTDTPVTFGGRLERRFARTPMQRWVAGGTMAGDYRDWAAIDRWTDTVVDVLKKNRTPQSTITIGDESS